MQNFKNDNSAILTNRWRHNLNRYYTSANIHSDYFHVKISRYTILIIIIIIINLPTKIKKCIAGVMACVLVANAVDREFKSQSGQTNDYKIGIIR